MAATCGIYTTGYALGSLSSYCWGNSDRYVVSEMSDTNCMLTWLISRQDSIAQRYRVSFRSTDADCRAEVCKAHLPRGLSLCGKSFVSIRSQQQVAMVRKCNKNGKRMEMHSLSVHNGTVLTWIRFAPLVAIMRESDLHLLLQLRGSQSTKFADGKRNTGCGPWRHFIKLSADRLYGVEW